MLLPQAAPAAAKAKAPEFSQAAVLALIAHQAATGEKTREGTGNAADKRQAWTAATAVNAASTHVYTVEQARRPWVAAGVRRFSRHDASPLLACQVKAKWNNLRTSYTAAKAAQEKSGAGAKAPAFWFDAMDKMLSERAATAPKATHEVGARSKAPSPASASTEPAADVEILGSDDEPQPDDGMGDAAKPRGKGTVAAGKGSARAAKTVARTAAKKEKESKKEASLKRKATDAAGAHAEAMATKVVAPMLDKLDAIMGRLVGVLAAFAPAPAAAAAAPAPPPQPTV